MNCNYMICTKCSYFSLLFKNITKNMNPPKACASCSSFCLKGQVSEAKSIA